MKSKIVAEITAANNSNSDIAMSLALGLFIAFSPAWGFQTVLAISLALVFKLNKVLTLLTVNISSIPPLIPLIIFAGYQTGALVLHGEIQKEVPDLMNFRNLGDNYLQFALGSFLFALLTASLFYLIVLILVKKYR